jgi:glutamate formiminotransferase
MRGHHGIHPRLGALDVMPFIPLREVTMDLAAAMARRVAHAIAAAHELPVYLYGAAAARPERRVVRDIRRGEYEGLAVRLTDPAWPPDTGPAVFVPRSGAVMVGARDVLVAYNVWLDSRDLDAARDIARAIRESSGGLPAVQALGLPLAQRGRVQVSINLVDYRRTGMATVYDAVAAHAQRRGIPIDRAELVGLAPRAALEGRRPETIGMPDFVESQYLEHYL